MVVFDYFVMVLLEMVRYFNFNFGEIDIIFLEELDFMFEMGKFFIWFVYDNVYKFFEWQVCLILNVLVF